MNFKALIKISNFFKLNGTTNNKILFYILILFATYCSLIVGKSWDEGAHLRIGKSTLDYLLSIGKNDNYTFYREHFSPIYWSLKYLITQVFPHKYQIEVTHIINLFFSISTIVGIRKIINELFNQQVSKLVFLILFFYPVFFGHMSFNGKDMFLAFCHVWIFYLTLKYLRMQNVRQKSNNYIIYIATLGAAASGLELVFLGTLIPIFLFIIIDIFFLKKIINTNFNVKIFFIDLVKVFFIFYFILILFWVDTHPNIFTLPYSYFVDHLSLVSGELPRGRPFNLINGEYHLSWQVPKLHFLINLLYKSPEYFLATYVIFSVIFIISNDFFSKRFSFFNYKICLIFSIMLLPVLIGQIMPVVTYDGMRHYLWVIPYFCVIPGLTIFYLIENFHLLKAKLTLSFLSIFILYLLYNFFISTPYQYTYLNLFNGKSENMYKKFENDYWGVSANELIKSVSFDKNKITKLAICGVHPRIFDYLKNQGEVNLIRAHPKDADYIIMTNRVLLVSGSLTKSSNNKTVKMMNCFDRFKGQNVFELKRNGLLLSAIRKKTNISNWN